MIMIRSPHKKAMERERILNLRAAELFRVEAGLRSGHRFVSHAEDGLPSGSWPERLANAHSPDEEPIAPHQAMGDVFGDILKYYSALLRNSKSMTSLVECILGTMPSACMVRCLELRLVSLFCCSNIIISLCVCSLLVSL